MSVFEKNDKYDGDLEFNYNFELSDFQKHAIDSWENNQNCLITAHTGSGKTLPAQYAIKKILERNLGKVIYTSPIKSLSNDKYKDLKNEFNEENVGLITGDIKFNPTAKVLVMTTEILRNLLYRNVIEDVVNKVSIEVNMKDVHTVIFDEVHYINDPDRGGVWEECFILLPQKINLMNLSATIDNPIHFCEWLCNIKKKDVIYSSTNKRIVPLYYNIYLDFLSKYLNSNEGHESQCFHDKLIPFCNNNNIIDVNKYTEICNHLKKKHSHLSKNQVLQNLIQYLKYNTLVPALFFCFSRKGCERLAKSIHINLLVDNEYYLIEDIIQKNLKKLDNYESYIRQEQYFNLMDCLKKGVAFHHSGLLPVFKELIEILFSHKDKDGNHRPLVKVLFATETFAVGVNMPTKVVVFTDLQKYTCGEKRYLKSHEFLQMSGRAGRRGIDDKGIIILLPNLFQLPDIHMMKNIVSGKSQSLVSKFKPNYKIILNSIENGNDISEVGKNSLISKEIQSDLDVLKKKNARL